LPPIELREHLSHMVYLRGVDADSMALSSGSRASSGGLSQIPAYPQKREHDEHYELWNIQRLLRHFEWECW
jgi:hypothetical protein